MQLRTCLFAVVMMGCGAIAGPQGDAKKSDSRLELAKEYLGKQELEAAEAEANKAIGYMSTNEEAYNVRGLVHYLRALNNRRLIEIDDCLTGVQAEVFDEDEDAQLAMAAADFTKAANLAPDFSEAWANRGAVANLMGSYDEAIAHLTKALENPFRLVNPGLSRATLGWANFQKEDYIRAAKELLQVKQFAPSECVPTYRLGRVYFAKGEWENAAQEFLAVDPSCGLQEASFYLMKTRMEQGLIDEANAARDACLRISPKSCIAQQCRAGAR
jgi:tetratricopeptide (TPR) repeat protein